MTKYVRTIDNRIIEITEKGCIKEFYGRMIAFEDKNLAHHEFNGVEFVKQADTIEELCDEFVIRHLTSRRPYVADEYQKTQILKDRQKAFEYYGVEEVYGAIWTDKGLIYVAKMVDGKLVLI